MRLRLVAAAIAVYGAAALAALGSTATAAPAQEVTLNVDRFFDTACNCTRVRFSGTVSSGREGEYVTVMQQKCGFSFSTAVAAATTGPGGHWNVDPLAIGASFGSGMLRARWNGHLSEPVSYRPPIRIYFSKQRDRSYRVALTANAKLGSPFIALQRLVGGRWTHVRRIRLDIGGSAGYGGAYWATFRVRTPGLKMRVFVPAATAAPCYMAAASPTFIS
jgi:hypothetical protein